MLSFIVTVILLYDLLSNGSIDDISYGHLLFCLFTDAVTILVTLHISGAFL